MANTPKTHHFTNDPKLGYITVVPSHCAHDGYWTDKGKSSIIIGVRSTHEEPIVKAVLGRHKAEKTQVQERQGYGDLAHIVSVTITNSPGKLKAVLDDLQQAELIPESARPAIDRDLEVIPHIRRAPHSAGIV